MAKVPVSFRLDDSTRARLNLCAGDLNVTQTDVIRLAVTAFYDCGFNDALSDSVNDVIGYLTVLAMTRDELYRDVLSAVRDAASKVSAPVE